MNKKYPPICAICVWKGEGDFYEARGEVVWGRTMVLCGPHWEQWRKVAFQRLNEALHIHKGGFKNGS